MTFAPVTSENIDEILDIYIKAFNAAPWNYNWNRDKARKYLLEYTDNPLFAGFIMYDQEEVAGAMLGRKKTWWTQDQLFIDEFFVSPDRQRHGYGKKLMEYCS